jgi:hypothetical protein
LNEADVTKEPAVGFSVTTNLDGNRQIVMQGFFAAATPADEANAVLDRVLALADRQRARYELPEVEEELRKHKDALAQFEEDRARVELDFTRDQARREVEIAEMEKVRDEERAKHLADFNANILKVQGHREEQYKLGLDAHVRGGRGGSYVPRGHDKANLDRVDSQIKALGEARDAAMAKWDEGYETVLAAAREEKAKKAAERDQALQGLDISVDRYNKAIALREERVAVLKKQIEG